MSWAVAVRYAGQTSISHISKNTSSNLSFSEFFVARSGWLYAMQQQELINRTISSRCNNLSGTSSLLKQMGLKHYFIEWNVNGNE